MLGHRCDRFERRACKIRRRTEMALLELGKYWPMNYFWVLVSRCLIRSQLSRGWETSWMLGEAAVPVFCRLAGNSSICIQLSPEDTLPSSKDNPTGVDIIVISC